MVAHSLQQEVNLSRRACRIKGHHLNAQQEEVAAEEEVEEKLTNGANQSPVSEEIAFNRCLVNSESSSIGEDLLGSCNSQFRRKNSSGHGVGVESVGISCDLIAQVFLLIKALVMGILRLDESDNRRWSKRASSSSSRSGCFSKNLVKWCTWVAVLSVLLANGGFVLARPNNGVSTADGEGASAAVS